MSYEKKMKAAMVKALKEAKANLSHSLHDRTKTSYICYALPHNWGGDLVREVIRQRLGSASTVGIWLNGRGYFAKGGAEQAHVQYQAYRQRWIDALIEEFS